MEATIKYIPASDKGPHYVEGGLRPDCGEHDMLTVIVQIKTGARHCARYEVARDGFVSLVVPTHIFRDVVCWHHLPDREPQTEREWFAAQFKPFGTPWCVMRFGPYSMTKVRGGSSFTTPDKTGEWAGRYAPGGTILKHWGVWQYGPDNSFDFDKIMQQMYDHWVASGRP